MIGRQTADGRHHFTFGGHALGTAAFVTAELLESDKVGIESVEIYHRRDSDGVLAAVEYPGDEPGINEDYDLPLVFRPYHDNAIGAGEFASLDGVLGQGSFESLDWSTV